MPQDSKRKAVDESSNRVKKTKYSKFKSTNRGNDNSLSTSSAIEAGNAGIWATCVRGLEAKATAQLRDVLNEYAEKLYPEIASELNRNGKEDNSYESDNENEDIESAVQTELEENKKSSRNHLFTTVRIDVACVLFFKVHLPIDPVSLVQQICRDAGAGKMMKRTRHINRLTPITLVGKASIEGLSDVASKVLPKGFNKDDGDTKTFAIRPTIRNHDVLKRDQVIEKVASMIGPGHSVNLSKPDLVILVEIYKNVCGMSVVDGDFVQLKRFNLNELYSVDAASA